MRISYRNTALSRRGAILSSAVFGLAACRTTDGQPGTPRDTATYPDRPLTLLYVRSSACPYCREWEVFAEPDWLRSPERSRLSYRVLDFFHFSNITAASGWPEDVRWVRDELQLTRGTPRFILIRDRNILGSYFGSNRWQSDVLPAVRQALA